MNILNYKLFVESVITRDKKKEIFDYSSIINDAWRDIIHEAKDFQNISFDLENNDSTGQKKTFYFPVMLRKDQKVKNEINAELCKASGDWEYPVMYFKIEFTHQYSLLGAKHRTENPEFIWDVEKDKIRPLSHCYVIIPPNEAGNKLTPKDNGGFSAFNNDIPKKHEELVKITEKDEKKAWKWLENLLQDLVDKRHKQLDLEEDNKEKDNEAPISNQ